MSEQRRASSAQAGAGADMSLDRTSAPRSLKSIPRLLAHQELEDDVRIVATKSNRAVKFHRDGAKTSLPDHAAVCLHSEIRTAQGCAQSVGLIRVHGSRDR